MHGVRIDSISLFFFKTTGSQTFANYSRSLKVYIMPRTSLPILTVIHITLYYWSPGQKCRVRGPAAVVGGDSIVDPMPPIFTSSS